ncbi:MAG: hypothetical protein K0S74_1359 [Chlamydiales bacterium]|jgi:formylglycine-generating enzyme required for sulfatase activity|nr:hypothetical protein [Chlamydiales bacterium]
MKLKSPLIPQSLQRVGSYEILEKKGQDYSGCYYTAKDSSTDLERKIHIISPDLVNNDSGLLLRFSLLKNLLSTLTHPYIVKILELNEWEGYYYIVKESHEDSNDPYISLENYFKTFKHATTSQLELIFSQLAEALSYLENLDIAYMNQGFNFDRLKLNQILIKDNKSSTHFNSNRSIKLDCFFETFLFWGENSNAALQQQISRTIYENCGNETNFFYEEFLTSYKTRQGLPSDPVTTQYAYGALCYYLATGFIPKGQYYKPSSLRRDLNTLWDEIIFNCLNAIYKKTYSGLTDVVHIIRPVVQNRQNFAINAFDKRQLPKLDIPKGMTLVSCEDKVELGANDGPLEEQPRFKARVAPFFIDIYPITCKQFKEFLPTYQPSTYSSGEDHPATLITWHMAKTYCVWRSQKEGLPPDSYRLPTEYEWEAAVRGSSGEQFPWGNQMVSQKVHCGQAQTKGSAPVDSYPAGRFGIYGMLGNIWEWTESLFQSHPFSNYSNKSYGNNFYTVKGGCWFTPVEQCRASLRAGYPVHERKGHIGFRCVRELPATLLS